MCVLAGYANFTRWLVVTWLRKTAQLGGALPGYTGFRDDRIDSLGQPGLAGAGASARPPVANGRAKLVLLRETDPMHLMPIGIRLASSHGDVTAIRRDKRFGKDFIGRITRRSGPQNFSGARICSVSHWMLQLDPPDHSRLRSLVVRAFTASRVEDACCPLTIKDSRITPPEGCELQ